MKKPGIAPEIAPKIGSATVSRQPNADSSITPVLTLYHTGKEIYLRKLV